MEKYSWNFNRDAENWSYAAAENTIKKCLAAAREAIKERDYLTNEPPAVVYIGENVPFVPWVDPDFVLENVEEQASEFAGEIGEDWDACDRKKKDELNELADSLSLVLNEWLKKYGYTPSFYAVENIKEYPL